MILPKPEDAIHKIQLYRLLTAILDSPLLARHVYFKGGTCASMRGLLDRFSVELALIKYSLIKNLPDYFQKSI